MIGADVKPHVILHVHAPMDNGRLRPSLWKNCMFFYDDPGIITQEVPLEPAVLTVFDYAVTYQVIEVPFDGALFDAQPIGHLKVGDARLLEDHEQDRPCSLILHVGEDSLLEIAVCFGILEDTREFAYPAENDLPLGLEPVEVVFSCPPIDAMGLRNVSHRGAGVAIDEVENILPVLVLKVFEPAEDERERLQDDDKGCGHRRDVE